MKKTNSLILSIALFAFCGQAAYGCSCVEIEPGKKHRVNYKELLEDFEGAVFVGQVVKIEKIEAAYKNKVTFHVEKYWTGVEGAEAVIYTAMDEAGCGVTFVEGKNYLVIAERFADRLHIHRCSWLGYSEHEKAYIKGFGKGKVP
jgi:hypothetical protein